MSISATVTTSPSGLPRVTLSISSTGNATITAVSLTRTASGGTTPTRVQPSAGPSPRSLNDYEADWDTLASYTAVVTSSAGTESFTSNVITVVSDKPWAIHPTTPALSFPLDQFTALAAGLRTLGDITRDATDTPHNVLGSPYRTYTKTGARSAPVTQIEFTTVTSLEAQTVRAALNDLTPLLIRVPAGLGWDWENGYYRVGQVSESRRIQYGPEPSRIFALPLERVEAPAGSQQAERTWANVLNDFPTWDAVRAAYASWTDVLTDTRR